MVNVEELRNYIDGLFETSTSNPEYFNECGLTNNSDKFINRVGYCTNLTLDVIEKAHALKVDFIITHHDAWGFIFGLKDKCLERLKAYNISHYYIHLPLDDCDFGTNATLLKQLNLNQVKRNCVEDGFSCGIIGEYDTALELSDVCDQLEALMEESVQCWQFNEKKIKRVQILCGAGHLTSDMKNAVEDACDLYITGERILYSIEYAQLSNLNLIVGSHTFTEIFGVRGLIDKINEVYKDIEFVLIKEDHLEAMNIKRV